MLGVAISTPSGRSARDAFTVDPSSRRLSPSAVDEDCYLLGSDRP